MPSDPTPRAASSATPGLGLPALRRSLVALRIVVQLPAADHHVYDFAHEGLLMPTPPWADNNLTADEIALLSDPPDWRDPKQVLLLRLAEARHMTLVFRRLLEAREKLDPPPSELSPAARERLEREMQTIPRRVPHECEWALGTEPRTAHGGFPYLLCRICRSSTQFYGALDGTLSSAFGSSYIPVVEP